MYCEVSTGWGVTLPGDGSKTVWCQGNSAGRQKGGKGTSFYVQKSQSGKRSKTIVVIFPGELKRLKGCRVH